MAHSKALERKAEQLRRDGVSIPNIAKKLGIAKSTAYHWVHAVPLPPALRERLITNAKEAWKIAHHAAKVRRVMQSEKNAKDAEKLVTSLLQGVEKDFWALQAALLYWCEGSKAIGAGMAFANSDPLLMKAYLFALRNGFEIDERRFHAIVHIHEYHDDKKQVRFWSRVTGIPTSQFMRSYRKPNTEKRKRDDYPGCCSVRYGDANMARRVRELYRVFAKQIEGV